MPVVPRHERRMADGRVSRGPDLAPLVWLLNAAVLGVLVVAPLAILVAASLSTREGLSFANFAAAFGRPLYRGPIVNSLVYASAVAVLSVGIARASSAPSPSAPSSRPPSSARRRGSSWPARTLVS